MPFTVQFLLIQQPKVQRLHHALDLMTGEDGYIKFEGRCPPLDIPGAKPDG